MPKTRLAADIRRKKCDPLKELIIGRATAYGLRDEDLAAAMGISPATLSRRKKQTTNEWTWGEIVSACRALDITTEELRPAVRI